MSTNDNKRHPRYGLLAFAALLSACAADEDILRGERLDLREGQREIIAQSRDVAISLGAQQTRSEWRGVGASRLNNSGHNAFTPSVPDVLWQVKVGEGNGRKYRILGAPVAKDGLIYSLDSHSTISAVDHQTGLVVWSIDVARKGENNDDAASGYLALDYQYLYATIGHGDLVAIDLKSGQEIWRQNLGSVGATGLTAHDGLIYAAAADGQAWAIEAQNGRIKWAIPGGFNATSRLGAVAPAISNKLAVLPFSTGDLLGVFRKGGVSLWNTALAGKRKESVYANISSLSSDPVISGNTVYVGNQSGRFAAFDLDTGARKWTVKEGGLGPAVVLGGSVFFVSDDNTFIRLKAHNGERVWKKALPNFVNDKPKKRQEIYLHYGPVAAGGKLWLASSDGKLRGIDPASGEVALQIDLPAGAASSPVVVNKVMYILLENGALIALG